LASIGVCALPHMRPIPDKLRNKQKRGDADSPKRTAKCAAWNLLKHAQPESHFSVENFQWREREALIASRIIAAGMGFERGRCCRNGTFVIIRGDISSQVSLRLPSVKFTPELVALLSLNKSFVFSKENLLI
jgi:hypothetical protein